MDNQFSEEISTGNKRKQFNLFLLICLVLVLIISVTIIIILSIRLKKKSQSNSYEETKKELSDLKEEFEKFKKNYTNQTYILKALKEENEQIINKYSNQNDTLNDIFNVFQNLISKINIIHSSISINDYVNVKEKVKSAKGLPDGTYDYISLDLVTYDKGYSVAFETYSRNSENAYTDEEYDDIVYKLSCICGINANIGVYGDNPHISFYVEDKNISLAMAALFNQQSIWDWSTNDIILNTFHQPKFYS